MAEAKEREICKFYVAGNCRFGDLCRNSHDTPVRVSQKTKKAAKKKEIDKKSDNAAEAGGTAKLPPMKTSRDVIQRIQWDEVINSQLFTIGYLDRFVGVVEQPFDGFDWTSDLASLDHTSVLAIPQHRIQYFKYRGQKVWDKNERMDLVFGSTSSSKVDLPDVLRGIDEDLVFLEDTILETEKVVSADDGTSKPTHFLAVRIDNENVVPRLQEVASDLSTTVGGKVAPELYHCTLALLTLDSVELVSHCTRLLNTNGPYAFANVPKHLDLTGLAVFRNRVLFARVTPDRWLDSAVDNLVEFLKRNDVSVHDRPKEFHVSLVKGHKYLRAVDQQKLAELEREPFGHQDIKFVHLCALRESPDLDGFYRVVTSIQVNHNSDNSENDFLSTER